MELFGDEDNSEQSENQVLEVHRLSDFLSCDFSWEYDGNPIEDFMTQQTPFKTLIVYSPLKENELPPFPPDLKNKWFDIIEQMKKWAVFKLFPQMYKLKQEWPEIMEKIKKKGNERIPLPSLLHYYSTLPKYYREQRAVQDLVRVLEKFHPYKSLEDKQLMVEELCYKISPKDPDKTRYLQEAFVPRRTWSPDIKDYPDPLPKVQPFNWNQPDAKEKVKEYEIPDFGYNLDAEPQENSGGKVPFTLTYYDNDDGYWDDWIKIKKEEQEKFPLPKKRQFFQH